MPKNFKTICSTDLKPRITTKYFINLIIYADIQTCIAPLWSIVDYYYSKVIIFCKCHANIELVPSSTVAFYSLFIQTIKMKIGSASLLLGTLQSTTITERKEYSSSAFGVWFVNCDNFFRKGAEWPLQEWQKLK